MVNAENVKREASPNLRQRRELWLIQFLQKLVDGNRLHFWKRNLLQYLEVPVFGDDAIGSGCNSAIYILVVICICLNQLPIEIYCCMQNVRQFP